MSSRYVKSKWMVCSVEMIGIDGSRENPLPSIFAIIGMLFLNSRLVTITLKNSIDELKSSLLSWSLGASIGVLILPLDTIAVAVTSRSYSASSESFPRFSYPATWLRDRLALSRPTARATPIHAFLLTSDCGLGFAVSRLAAAISRASPDLAGNGNPSAVAQVNALSLLRFYFMLIGRYIPRRRLSFLFRCLFCPFFLLSLLFFLLFSPFRRYLLLLFLISETL